MTFFASYAVHMESVNIRQENCSWGARLKSLSIEELLKISQILYLFLIYILLEYFCGLVGQSVSFLQINGSDSNHNRVMALSSRVLVGHV